MRKYGGDMPRGGGAGGRGWRLRAEGKLCLSRGGLRCRNIEGMHCMRAPSRILLIALALGLAGCGHGAIERKLDRPAYYFDNTLSFQPNRIWRLKVTWEPYLLDRKKALVVKQFQLIVHADENRRRLENEIAAQGGDAGYLRWLENEIFPIGNWENRDEARIARVSDMTVISLTTKAIKEVPMKGQLTLGPVYFPDPLMRAVTEGCHELNWDVIPKDDSVGMEVVLQSRSNDPGAEKWNRTEYDSPVFWWRQWSVGQEHSIAYRTAIQFKTNIARCPLPPKIHEEFGRIVKSQPMGVDW